MYTGIKDYPLRSPSELGAEREKERGGGRAGVFYSMVQSVANIIEH